jgi:hypothetical protein
LGGKQPAVAIVSANAFDRALDNTLGIAPEDFVVKPVRHTELLDWLERKLELVWLDAAQAQAQKKAPATVLQVAASVIAPPLSDLLALQSLVQLGYLRGILNKLESIEIEHPRCSGFVEGFSRMTRDYQFDAMLLQLQKVMDEPQTH